MSMHPKRSGSATPPTDADPGRRTIAICARCEYQTPSKRCLDGRLEPMVPPTCPECGGAEFVTIEYDNPMQGE